ncbi:MAG: hypothetical protein JXQ72_10055 [Anaerolineae bacterium]|nr:hypothetical protein [Anaerolineae bacterium]
MSASMIVIAVVFGAITGIAALLPLVQGEPEPVHQGPRGTAHQNRAMETLNAEKWRVLRSLRDLDFDYDMGKLTDDVYTAQRIDLIRLGAAIVQRLDALEGDVLAQQARIEAAVAAFRQQSHKSA